MTTPKEPTMPNNEELLKLAARCEAAVAGDRELDAAIAAALGEALIHDPGDDWFILCIGGLGRRAVPAFTASLDAAMTLKPEGWAEYHLMNINGYDEATVTNHAAQRTAWSSGKTPALALTAACLRARAAA